MGLGGINFLTGNKNRRGFSLTKKTVKVLYPLLPEPNGKFRRSTSRGRNKRDSEDRGKERKSRSSWGNRIKYVEKIETAPKRYGSRAQGRSIERANSGLRPARISRGIGR